jgi:hypothetical protein
MKRCLLLLFLLWLPSRVFAAEAQWLCTEESSQRQGNVVLSCGVALGDEENEARSKAFDNARAEFKKVCDASFDCRGHETTVTPKRTSCDEIAGKTAQIETKYRCYRLLAFTIGKPIGSAAVPVLYDNPDNFQTFSYSQISRLPKIRPGMSKADVVGLFGAPENVDHVNLDRQIFFYKGKMCSDHFKNGYRSGTCGVIFDNSSVSGIENFSFKYTEDLK